jgi:hypothetical protein
LLEYAVWAHDLSEAQIIAFASTYWAAYSANAGKSFAECFCETFEVNEVPALNQGLRLFIVAENIPATIARVCCFLRMSQGMDISCLEVSADQTGVGDFLVSLDPIVGQEDIAPPKHPPKSRWTGEKPVKQVVWEAVTELTQGDKQRMFSPKEVADNILRTYPTFNKSTVGCQIISDCVNHTSRHHYPGGEDRYWWLGAGKYRLYDPLQDPPRGSPPSSARSG